MGARLLPLNIAELCAHALELERDAAQRCKEYAARMRELGEDAAAASFDAMHREEIEEIAALEAASGSRKPAELSPWEYAWRLTYTPEAMENRPRLVPLNAREALQLVVLAKRRAEAFYGDVADNAREPVVRGCAAEMVANEKRQLQRLQRLLAEQIRNEQRSARKGDAPHA
jgi:rubrerythrin